MIIMMDLLNMSRQRKNRNTAATNNPFAGRVVDKYFPILKK